MENKRKKGHVSVAVAAIFIYVGSTIVGLIVQIIAAVVIWKDPFAAEGVFVGTLIAAIISGVCVYAVVRKKNLIKIEAAPKKDIALTILIALIGALFASSILLSGIANVVQSEDMLTQMTIWDSVGDETNNMTLALVTMVLVVPVSEEIIFRAAIFGGLRDKVGFLLASVISSVLFGLAHGTVVYAIGMFIFGMFMCVAYEKTRNLLTNILVHMLNNAIAFIPFANKIQEIGIAGGSSKSIDVVIIVCSLAIGIISYSILYKRSRSSRKSSWEAAAEGDITSRELIL